MIQNPSTCRPLRECTDRADMLQFSGERKRQERGEEEKAFVIQNKPKGEIGVDVEQV